MTTAKKINNSENSEFAAMFESSITARDNFSPGDKVEGIVVGIAKDTIFVDISGKSEATISADEFIVDGKVTVKSGDHISAYVIASGVRGVELTSCLGKGPVSPAILQIAKDNNIPIEGTVSGKVNGGFSVIFGTTRGFCPMSQIDRKFTGNDADYIGKKFPFSITEMKGRDVVVSRRSLLETIQKNAESELKTKLSVGDIRTGSVTRIAEFGIFVDFGGIEGLVPRSELSRARSIGTDAFSIGQSVSVKIMSIDWESKKILTEHQRNRKKSVGFFFFKRRRHY